MFTGIVEEIGTVENIRHGPKSALLTISGKMILMGPQEFSQQMS